MTPLTLEAVPTRAFSPLEVTAEATKTILLAVGKDPNRDGLSRTPQRLAKQSSKMVTSAMKGELLGNPAVRDEFMNPVGRDYRR